jgi:hypothetical protein
MKKDYENKSTKTNPTLAVITKNGDAVCYDDSMYRYTGQCGFYVNSKGKAIEVKPINLHLDLYLPYRYQGEHNTRKLAKILFSNQQGRDENGTLKDRFNRS